MRFLLTGTFVLAIATANLGVASAADTATTTTDTAVPVTATAYEPAAPTAGADLAMWGVTSADPSPAEPEGTSTAVRRFAGGIISRSASIAVTLTRNAMRFLGVPYVFGGTSVHGFDCSGYVQHVFAMMGLRLPRTADAQYFAGRAIGGRMEPGDLVFFQTYEAGPSHVGIYLGNDEFVHASSHGVMVSSLHDSYWANRYLGAKRYTM